jgi:HK97 family phage major capsid protein
MNPRERLLAVEAELRSIHEAAGDNPLADDAQAKWDELTAERAQLQETIRRDDERRAQVASFATRQAATESGDSTRREAPAQINREDPFDVLERARSLKPTEARRQLIDANIRAIDGRIEDPDHQRQFERLLKRHGNNLRWVENLLARQRPEYESGWSKLMTGNGHLLDDEERAAMTVGTNTAGGHLVPTHLDPSLMLTSAGSTNVLRQLARVVTLVEGSVWHGVTTAAVTASWDAEVTEVSDDTPAIGPASVTVTKPQAFVQASIEMFEDVANLTSDVLMLFVDAKETLEGAGFMTGSGSSQQPTGLFTAINASASLQTTSTTAATIGEVDLGALKRSLPQRWRNRGTWVMNPLYADAIKRLGTAVSSTFSGDLTQPTSDRILGRPVVESDDAPTTQTTTALDQEIVFADLKQYVIADKPGNTSIEFIPHIFGTNHRPTGTRGWYMHWRTGGNFVNLVAGRILVDKTSA